MDHQQNPDGITPQDPAEYAAASGTGNPDAERSDIAEEVPPAQATGSDQKDGDEDDDEA